jgi:flagellar hook protein FlgE
MPLSASLNVGVSALKTFAEGIQVTSNNISNVNTVGYKASRAQYSDTFSNLLKPMVPNTTNTGAKVPPTQIGGGVQIESVQAVFSQGTIQTSANNSDMAIAGAGFFIVKDPLSGKTMATRSGNFRLDADGFLVTQQGHRVQGAYGASTVVKYDAVTGDVDVQSVNDNVKLSAVSLTQNDTWVEVASVDDLAEGMVVSGSGIPYGAKIDEIDSSAVPYPKIKLSLAPSVTTKATEASKGPIVTTSGSVFADIDAADIDSFNPGDPVLADGIPVGTRVVSVNGKSSTTYPHSVTVTGTKGLGYITLPSADVAKLSVGMKVEGIGPTSISGVAVTANSGNTLTVGDTTGLVAGMRVTGTGPAMVPAEALIVSVDANTKVVTLSETITTSPANITATNIQEYRITKIVGDVVTFDQDLTSAHTSFEFTPTITLSDAATAGSTIAVGNLSYITNGKYESFASLSFGNKYKPALLVGDVRISFDEGADKDYTFIDTNGATLSGLNLANARSKVPQLRSFNIGTSGEISVILSNGQTFNGGSVLLQSFKDPGALIREGSNMFSGLDTAGRFNGEFTADNIQRLIPGMAGLGVINGASLELSNVDLGEEFSNMIITQRAFQAGSRIISTTDSMMEEVVNLKR